MTHLYHSLDRVEDSIKSISAGDLSLVRPIEASQEVEHLSDAVRNTADKFRNLVATVQASSETIEYSTTTMDDLMQNTHDSASQISIMMDGVANMAQKNTQLSSDSSVRMKELEKHLDDIHTFTATLDDLSVSTQSSSTSGQEVVAELIRQSESTASAVESLGGSVREIAAQMQDMHKITETILEISGKTHLLALNAAIESARAGEHGRGFSVVAKEIGVLADQSKHSSNEIQQMISRITQRMESSLDLIEDVESALDSQLNSVTLTLSSFGEIGSSILEIGTGIDTISDLVIQVGNIKNELSSILSQVSLSSRMTSSTTQQVTASSAAQLQSFEQVSGLCSELKVLSKSLYDSSQAFTYVEAS